MHAVLPADLDDPARPSGGNVYDRRVLRGLADLGRRVVEHPARGSWPRPTPADRVGVRRILGDLPDGSVVLVDGLIASAATDGLRSETTRLNLVVLVHLPLGTDDERDLLRRVAAVVVTSRWTRSSLVDRGVDPALITVAEPGVDPAPVSVPSPGGERLLCVGVIAPHKGHDVLVAALSRLRDLRWSCPMVGAPDVDPEFGTAVRRAAGVLGDRIRFRGPLTGADLAAAYADADLLVLPSRTETFGMVVGEALARGLPVVAADVGGIPLSLGRDPSGARPGLLVASDDPAALAGALRSWLTDAGLRDRLRSAALRRRPTLAGWSATAGRVADALLGVTV